MGLLKIKLFYNTVKYLKPTQVYYRLYYFIKKRFFIDINLKRLKTGIKPIKWRSELKAKKSYFYLDKSFFFLNISHSFSNRINWNLSNYGKLWTYNLNYFDFLNQSKIDSKVGLSLIKDFIDNKNKIKDGKEPYPISIRGINWIKFLSENNIQNQNINQYLYKDYRLLLKNLEYHLLGNHLLENAFSLFFASYFFQNKSFYNVSSKILTSELNEQILDDGGHFELSPMYHQLIFYRLLDCLQLIKLNNFWDNKEMYFFLKDKATMMNSWLKNITYIKGEIPMVNDSTYNIAPQSKDLFSYASKLDIKNKKILLSDSGYRKINFSNFELLIDVGEIGPTYQPGHAHSDTFNFELIKSGNPVIVDTGISSYEKNTKRIKERSTSSHNTVKFGNFNQSEVWDSFRVANRAKVFFLKENKNFIKAKHDGYKSKGFIHSRSFQWKKNKIIIIDEISKSTGNNARAFFHFHSSIKKPVINENKVFLKDLDVIIYFKNKTDINIEKYDLSKGFNKVITSYKLIVKFDKMLKTEISL